jgi:hypothetical protein
MAVFIETDVISDPDQLGYEVNPASFAAGVEEILINTTTKTISLKVVGNLKNAGATIKAVYSKLKDAWRVNNTLIKFPFPMGPITDEAFEMVNGWNWDKVNTSGTLGAALNTTELLRTGGWSVVATNGNPTEQWASVITLGTLGDTDQVYYQQVNSAQASVNFSLTGKVNQAIQILSDPNADLNTADGYSRLTYFKIFVREWQKLYAQSAIGDIGVTSLQAQAYRFPLTNSTDLKVTVAESYVATGVSISNIVGNGTTVTVDTATNHGLVTGDSVIIAGATGYNGTYQVTVVDADTFTFLAAGTGTITTGTARKAIYANVTITYLRNADGGLYNVIYGATPTTVSWVSGSNYVRGDVVSVGAPLRWYELTAATLNNSTVSPASDTTNWAAYTGEKQIGTSYWPFTVLVDGDTTVAATASGAARTADIYTAVQYALRQATDIDASTGSVTGKTADSLLRFVGDTLVTSRGVYVESFNSLDTNSITFTDASSLAGVGRTFPFVANLTVNFGTNLQNDQYAKYWVFFTAGVGAGAGNDFGTANAIIVKDADGADMANVVHPAWPTKRTKVEHTYNYDSNNQRSGGTHNTGSGSQETPAPITVVGIGLKTSQYVLATGTIERSNANSVTLTSSLERNYEQGNTYP